MRHIKLYEEFAEEKHEVNVSLRYAKQANEIFDDMFKDYGEKIASDVFAFSEEDYKHDFIETLKKANIPAAEIFESANMQKSETLQIAIVKAINEIDESMSYQDFAKAVANVLREEYGTHNFEPFMKTLKDELGK